MIFCLLALLYPSALKGCSFIVAFFGYRYQELKYTAHATPNRDVRVCLGKTVAHKKPPKLKPAANPLSLSNFPDLHFLAPFTPRWSNGIPAGRKSHRHTRTSKMEILSRQSLLFFRLLTISSYMFCTLRCWHRPTLLSVQMVAVRISQNTSDPAFIRPFAVPRPTCQSLNHLLLRLRSDCMRLVVWQA